MDKFQLCDRSGVSINPGEEYDHPYDWANLGSLTVAITTPAVGARDRATIALLVTAGSVLELTPPKAIWTGAHDSPPTQPNGAISYEVRFRSNGDEDGSYVVDILNAAGPLDTEHYTRRATLTGTQGTQAATIGYFHDAVVGSNEAWMTDPTDVPSTARANYIGSYLFNVHGNLSFIFAPTTIPSGATLYIDCRRFS